MTNGSFTAGDVIAPLTVASYLLTTTNVLLASVQIAAANSSRKGFVIYNNGANTVYISFANPATSAACVLPIATFQPGIFMYPICYSGALYAIRNAGSGACSVWEIY